MPNPQNQIKISFNKTTAHFSPQHGGMMTSLIMQAPEGLRELLYFAPEFDFDNYHKMNGGAPFCFPICGRLLDGSYAHENKVYPMKIHGFGYLMPWEVIDQQTNSISLRLTENKISLAQYPFQFEVILTYIITDDNELTCRQSYKNTGDQPMPYYAGFHPYLSLPFPKEETFLSYQPQARLIYNDELTDVIGETSPFQTPINISTPELNESLAKLGDNKFVYLNFPDQTYLELQTQGIEDKNLFPYVQLYHRAAEPFLCIEPWMSFPNAMNHTAGVRWLAPGQIEHGLFYLRLKKK